MPDYALAELPYDYADLEPRISGDIMELHHSKHHQTFVKGANTAIDHLAKAREAESLTALGTLGKNLAFHLGGYFNHSVFWPIMAPDGGGKPDGDLATDIDEWFGSFNKFRAHVQANALAVQASGWSILTWDVVAQRMYIVRLYDHQGDVPVCTVPLLLRDMCEHACYLVCKNDKATFVQQWWNIVNQADVQNRFACAKTPTQGLILP